MLQRTPAKQGEETDGFVVFLLLEPSFLGRLLVSLVGLAPLALEAFAPSLVVTLKALAFSSALVVLTFETLAPAVAFASRVLQTQLREGKEGSPKEDPIAPAGWEFAYWSSGFGLPVLRCRTPLVHPSATVH